MTAIQRLKQQISRQYPTASIEEERFPAGSTWLDVRLNGALVVVKHQPGQGYGLSEVRRAQGLVGYGEGPDRIFSRYSDAQRHLLKLLRKIGHSARGHPSKG